MKINKAVKLVAALTTITAGIGTVVYFIKDKADRKRLSEDFDDFEDDFDDFDDEGTTDPEDNVTGTPPVADTAPDTVPEQ
jgi:predicted oxidoreductase (fatty acid repression mutant protein)